VPNSIGEQLASYPPNQQPHWQQRVQENNQQQFNQQQLNQQQFNQQEINQSTYSRSGSLPNDGMSLLTTIQAMLKMLKTTLKISMYINLISKINLTTQKCQSIISRLIATISAMMLLKAMWKM